jgi:xylan 1,4-beta-xylosidase
MPAPIDIVVDAATAEGPLPRLWASFGYDELNWTATPRGLAHLATMREVFGEPPVVRAHNLLTSGSGRGLPHWSSGNVYHEDEEGRPFYDFTVSDAAFDAWVGAGMRPLVELGFCPQPLTSPVEDRRFHPMPSLYGVYEAWEWASPPRDLSRWGDLVRAVAAHSLERYGADEVAGWYWEVWNEPDIGYWQGTLEQYCDLYDISVHAVRSILPEAQVGGPATTGGGVDFLAGFLEHCVSGRHAVTGEVGVPLDFVSFHTKGARDFPRTYGPTGPDGVQGGEPESPSTEKMLAEITANLDVIRAHPSLAEIPVIVDECDPGVPAHSGVYDNRNYQFNNTEYYPVFMAQLMAALADLDRPDRRGVALTTAWTWYLEADRWFEGTRSFFTAADVPTPVTNGYRMLGRLGAERLAVTGADAAAGSRVLATRDGDGTVAVLVTHHNDDQYQQGVATATVEVTGLPLVGRPVVVRHHRIDADRSNSHAAWVRAGRPQNPSDDQLAAIRARAGLEPLEENTSHACCPERLRLVFDLPQPGMSLIEIIPAD